MIYFAAMVINSAWSRFRRLYEQIKLEGFVGLIAKNDGIMMNLIMGLSYSQARVIVGINCHDLGL